MCSRQRVVTKNCDMLNSLFTAYEHWGTKTSTQKDHHERVGEWWRSAEKIWECVETWLEEGGPCWGYWDAKNTGRAKYLHRHFTPKKRTEAVFPITYLNCGGPPWSNLPRPYTHKHIKDLVIASAKHLELKGKARYRTSLWVNTKIRIKYN